LTVMDLFCNSWTCGMGSVKPRVLPSPEMVDATTATTATTTSTSDEEDTLSHPIGVCQPWFSHLMSGKKTVLGREAQSKWKPLKVGQSLVVNSPEYECAVFVVIGIRHYPSLKEYLEAEGVDNCLPGIKTVEEGIAIYNQWSTDEDLAKYDFLAIEVKLLYKI